MSRNALTSSKTSWEALLDIQWPKDRCDRSGECCRGAAQIAPWERLLKNAANGDATARDFLNQFIPYPHLEVARTFAPDAVEASLKIARDREEREDHVIFYHCRFLVGKSDCQIYEDRPSLCRDFPESPFGAIPRCCGYFDVAQSCHHRIDEMRTELANLKKQQFDLNSRSNIESD